MRQWEERIAEFVPNAHVGRIQGPTVDIDGKDIVIGNVTVLSNEGVSTLRFMIFGLSIWDEVPSHGCRSIQQGSV